MATLEQPVKTVSYPAMRIEVMSALASLADPEYQKRAWGQGGIDLGAGVDNLTMCIHSLYDDNQVLPDPARSQGTVLSGDEEISRLRLLGSVLDRVIERHGDAPDPAYLADPEWCDVQREAAMALIAMVRSWALPWPSERGADA